MTKGEGEKGVKESEKFADVIYGSPLSTLVNPTPSHGTACLPFSLGRRESVKNVHLRNRVGLIGQKQVAMDHRSSLINTHNSIMEKHIKPAKCM